MNAALITSMFPSFIRCECENWRYQTTYSIKHTVHDCLCCKTTLRIQSITIHPIFGDINIKRAELMSTELVNLIEHLAELIGVIGLAAF